MAFTLRARFALVGTLLFLAALAYYGYAALTFPSLFNLDNRENFAATRYLAEHHRIPSVAATTEGVEFTSLGTTRSTRPPLTFIVTAMTDVAFEGLLDDRLKRQRLGSAVLGAITITIIFAGFTLTFSSIGLSLFGALAIGLLPKFVFLASSNNDDIGAILSVSALFACVLALVKHREARWPLIAIAASIGLILQSKFTAWLCLPWLALYCLYLIRGSLQRFVKLLPALLMIMVLAGGWWLIFNLVNYGLDDPTGLKNAAEIQRTLNDGPPNRSGYLSRGVSLGQLMLNHDDFLVESYKSFIGYLEWLELEMGAMAYWFYGGIFSLGIAMVPLRRRAHRVTELNAIDPRLDWLVLILILVQCGFYFHHNLVRDVQPQARYILPIIMPLMYLFLRFVHTFSPNVISLVTKTRVLRFPVIAAACLLSATALVHAVTFGFYVTPSYQQRAFYTQIGELRHIDLQKDIVIVESDGIEHDFNDEELTLTRSSMSNADLTLSPSICALLPVNTLIAITTKSSTGGGLRLRIDKQNHGDFRQVHWQSVSPGESLVLFSFDASNCSGLKISLPRGTGRLTLTTVKIAELKIHRHGKSI